MNAMAGSLSGAASPVRSRGASSPLVEGRRPHAACVFAAARITPEFQTASTPDQGRRCGEIWARQIPPQVQQNYGPNLNDRLRHSLGRTLR
jgi:hypothetical protein